MAEHRVQKVGFKFVGDYADRIAHATNNWSWMEYELLTVLWSLADVSPAVGACLTSQIYTFNGKLDALLALMKLRKVPSDIVDSVNKFSSDSRSAQDARNRFAHDVWLNDNENPQTLGKLRVTASKKLDFQIEPFPIERVQADLAKIEAARIAFSAIRRAITAAQPSLPEMSQQELHPINELR